MCFFFSKIKCCNTNCKHSKLWNKQNMIKWLSMWIFTAMTRLDENTEAVKMKSSLSTTYHFIYEANKRIFLLEKRLEYYRKQMFHLNRSTTWKYLWFLFCTQLLSHLSIYFDFQIVFVHLISQLLESKAKKKIGNSNMAYIYINYSNEKLKRIRNKRMYCI